MDLPGLSWVGIIKAPSILAVLLGLIWLSRAKQTMVLQVKVMLAFLIFEFCRLLIGQFFLKDGYFLTNTFWQFQTLKNLFLQYPAITFAMVAFMSSGLGMRRFAFFAICAGGFLGLYGLTHSGFGPGGFVRDENDLCLVLVMLLPFPVVFIKSEKLFHSVTCIAVVFLMLAGVVVTHSRGGFLGFIAAVSALAWFSKYRLRFVIGVALVATLVLPFVPAAYLSEVESIKTDLTSKEGTIRERFDTWSIIWNMWSDPSNVVFGTGLQNTPWNMHRYESVERGTLVKSLAGRQAHSLYFQLLGDLGLWGVLYLVLTIGVCIAQVRRLLKKIDGFISQTQVFVASLRNTLKSQNENELQAPKLVLAHSFIQEALYLRNFSRALLAAWMGTLGAGVGISVLYYPPLWTLVGISIALDMYWKKLYWHAVKALSTDEQV